MDKWIELSQYMIQYVFELSTSLNFVIYVSVFYFCVSHFIHISRNVCQGKLPLQVLYPLVTFATVVQYQFALTFVHEALYNL